MQQQIAFSYEELIKYIGLVAGLIVAGVGIYNLIIYTFKKLESKIDAINERLNEMESKQSAMEETHKAVTGSLIEISTTQNAFMARAEEQWERQNGDMKSVIGNQAEFNKLVAERFAKYDESILDFYKKNGHLFNRNQKADETTS
jgi:uncharacterized protein YbjQ (UPF0145 family)